MSYKNLPLNRSLIECALNNYPSVTNVKFYDGGNNLKKCELSVTDEKEALINFFYNKNGKTTVQITQGQNKILSQKVADFIIEQCQIVVTSKDVFSIRGLQKEQFDLLLEYLVEECESLITASDIPYGKKYNVEGCQGDSITLTYYTKGTFMIQGCPVLLHSQVVEFLSEVLDLEELIQSQLNLIKVELTSKDVLGDMSATMPYSFDNLDNTVKAIISPSIALSKLDIELEDYTVIAFPALRGLEGYMKSLFHGKGIVIGKKGFAPHLNDGYHATLSDNARKSIDCDKTCTAINRCYGYYKDERHGLFHASGILANSRLIKEKKDAVNIVNGVLQLIEESHNLIRG